MCVHSADNNEQNDIKEHSVEFIKLYKSRSRKTIKKYKHIFSFETNIQNILPIKK